MVNGEVKQMMELGVYLCDFFIDDDGMYVYVCMDKIV